MRRVITQAFPVRWERKIQDGGKYREAGYPLARLGTAVSFPQVSVYIDSIIYITYNTVLLFSSNIKC